MCSAYDQRDDQFDQRPIRPPANYYRRILEAELVASSKVNLEADGRGRLAERSFRNLAATAARENPSKDETE